MPKITHGTSGTTFGSNASNGTTVVFTSGKCADGTAVKDPVNTK